MCDRNGRPMGRSSSSNALCGEGFQLMVGSVDGGPVTAIGPTRPAKTGGADVRFSPDGSRILAFYNADRTTWVLDPAGGPGTKLDYAAITPPTWQGRAR